MSKIILVAFDGVEPLDVTGPASIFAKVKGLAPHAPEIVIASPNGGTVVADAGVVFGDTVKLSSLMPPYSLILVAGGNEEALLRERDSGVLASWIKEASKTAQRMGSVCSGAFVLAHAGLLEGKKATTHWSVAHRLQVSYKNVQVDGDAIFIVDGNICTSAGITTGMDLALAIVEADYGQHVAATIARQMVLFLRRPGGQAQFSMPLLAQSKSSERLGKVIAHILNEPNADLSVKELAKMASMSERNFARKFTEEQGMSPAAFVANARLDHVKHLLETTNLQIESIAYAAGYSAVETLQRVFRNKLKTTPRAYRERIAGKSVISI